MCHSSVTRAFIYQALFLCAPFLFKMENVHLVSSSLPRLDKCHETSRIFPRTEQTFASAGSFGVISWASFWRKNVPFGFNIAPSAPSKKPSQSQKGHFYKKMNALNDTKWPFWLWEVFLRGWGRPLKAKRAIFPRKQSKKTKLKKWHQNSWHWQKSAQSSEIFVTSHGICQSVGASSRKRWTFSFLDKKWCAQK